MEAFDLITTGAWSILPPLLALGLALLTKEVYTSLTVGVFVGMIIYQFSLNGAGVEQFVAAFTMVPRMMAEQIAGNGALLLFLSLLGALTVLVAMAGGSRAYAEWVSEHIKNARVAQVMTFVLGILLFVDDYFNCLTVGAVMRPVAERFGISNEKLAWIIDSTAAPVCIIAPVSSWAVAVGGYLGENGFHDFVRSIPYNFYALLTIFFVLFMASTKYEFGPMRTAQREHLLSLEEKEFIPGKSSALKKLSTVGLDEDLLNQVKPEIPTVVAEASEVPGGEALVALEEYKGLKVSNKGTIWDLIIPLVVLIVFAILGMLYMGGYFEGTAFAEAVGVDPVSGLCIGVSIALVVAAVQFLPRKLMSLDDYISGVSEGVRSMVGAIMILVLAWSLGGMCRHMLGTGEFVSGFLLGMGVDLAILPAIIFVVSAFIGFSMGTSWGTIALILPIVLGVFEPTSPLYLLAVGATLGGSVYGDHVSPISDTTILSSTGASCNHLRHVATQLPYASLVMVVSFCAYLIAGFFPHPWILLIIGACVLVVACMFLSRRSGA